MPYLAAILGVLASLPKLLDWIEKLARAIVTWMDQRRDEKLQEDLKKGIEKAKRDKDTSDLEKPFR